MLNIVHDPQKGGVLVGGGADSIVAGAAWRRQPRPLGKRGPAGKPGVGCGAPGRLGWAPCASTLSASEVRAPTEPKRRIGKVRGISASVVSDMVERVVLSRRLAAFQRVELQDIEVLA